MESGDFPKHSSCDFEQNSLVLFTLSDWTLGDTRVVRTES